ncbi:hypothetical protein K0817_003005 [Microbacterium sp. HD4P20]|uniref:hypothetical protein n=1 Tax=Microbacterium sp. HD4P20 TaxID=2864874 RepID=UPI001C63FAE5|nr:hypothetical protein [Microbacterium sp. HD4P20]MCP2635531.1 hypothetical protein [Microbacterium sp. HD4P20]
MDDTKMEELLYASSPPTVVPPELSSLNDEILARAARRRTGRRRWLAGVVAGLLVVAGGSVAVAGDGRLTPWGWVADNIFAFAQPDGSLCFQGMRIDFRGLDQDAPIVTDAQEILRGIDVSSLDTTQMEKGLVWEATESKHNPNPITQAELKQSAIGTMVAEILFDELAARGYDLNPSPISMAAQTTECGA